MQVILDRKANPSAKSYTASLLREGVGKIRKKLIEEAAELFEASQLEEPAGRERVVAEAADVVYHLLVLLAAKDIPLDEVAAELVRREGLSGLEEKARRESPGST